jgi:hypothetical protein
MEVPQLVNVKTLMAAVHGHDNRKGDGHFASRHGNDKDTEQSACSRIVCGEVGETDKVDVCGIQHELNGNEHANEMAAAHQAPNANPEQQKCENQAIQKVHLLASSSASSLVRRATVIAQMSVIKRSTLTISNGMMNPFGSLPSKRKAKFWSEE